MNSNAAVSCGFALDLLLADPDWMPHPVVYMGKSISALEDVLRSRLPRTPAGELLGGALLAAALPGGTYAITSGALALARKFHPAAALALETLWCWQALALKGLAVESGRVQDELEKGDLASARKAVGRIVGRDTEHLTAEGVAKAAVETVAENFSDGVAAPLFYMLAGGAPLALAYKAVNTLDSMVGYKNERYLRFGRASAKLDDLVNLVPSRLAALCWIGGAFLTGYDGRGAWRIWRRDRRKHASPNAAQLESACAGALGVQLAGPAAYFGKIVDKPAIGDAGRVVEPGDIARARRMLYAAGGLALAGGMGLKALLRRK